MKYVMAKSLLGSVQVITEKYSALDKLNGEGFNIFSILKMERLEYQTHSAFLYEFLNPRGSHQQGYIYLKVFIREILEIKDFKWADVIVERERSIGEYGRIDLVVENKTDLLIIEIKIDAVDQENQLKRYECYAKNTGKNYRIYYLTLMGDEASQISIGDNKENINYKCLSFRTHVLKWLKKSIGIGNTPLIPSIRESLVQYVKLVEKITGQVSGGVKMEVKNLLLQNKNLMLADELVQAIPYAKAELEYEFWKRFYEEYNPLITAFGFEYEEDNFFERSEDEAIEIIVEQRKKRTGDVPFKYTLKKIDNKEMVLWIGQTGEDKSIYMSIGILQEDEPIKYTDWNKELLIEVQRLGFTLCSKHNKYKYIHTELNFYNETIYKLIENMNEIVGLIGEEIIKNCTSVSEKMKLMKF